jgi:hypothetical protein
VMQIATGQVNEDEGQINGKNAAAVALGRIGGKARAETLTATQRSKIARSAARKRWQRNKD